MTFRPALYTPADQTTGHGPWLPVGFLPPPAGASANVFINSLPAHKVGDITLPHLVLPPDIHPDVIDTGHPTVFVNRTPIAIAGASILAPGGVVTGLAAINVLVGIGNLNTVSRANNFLPN